MNSITFTMEELPARIQALKDDVAEKRRALDHAERKLEAALLTVHATADAHPLTRKEDFPWEDLLKQVPVAHISTRLKNVLAYFGIQFIGELAQKSEEELRKNRNCGTKTIKEVEELLAGLADGGITLGMSIPGWEERLREHTGAAPPPKRSLPWEDLLKTVEDLPLATRTANALQNARIRYIGQLAQKSEEELLKTKNFGRRNLKYVKEVLAELADGQITLGMHIPGWEERLRQHTGAG